MLTRLFFVAPQRDGTEAGKQRLSFFLAIIHHFQILGGETATARQPGVPQVRLKKERSTAPKLALYYSGRPRPRKTCYISRYTATTVVSWGHTSARANRSNATMDRNGRSRSAVLFLRRMDRFPGRRVSFKRVERLNRFDRLIIFIRLLLEC